MKNGGYRKRILLVCLGNICRSSLAHGVLQAKVDQAGLSEWLQVESAGTAAWHVGEAPDGRAIDAARTRGYDLTPLRAQQVQESDFSRFDLLLAMDDSNFDELLDRCPSEYTDRVHLFLPYVGVTETHKVPDPYYGGDEGFYHVLDLVEKAADNLVARLRDDEL